MTAPDVSCEVLDNGLTVLLCETDVAPVAEFQIWARVGAADERDGERGVAHFHEHMLFKGTDRRGVGEIAGEIEGAGGRINAYTSYDVTVYHATTPADRLDTGIDVLCDAVLHSSFDPAEIDREIQVVLEEIRRSEDSPGSVLGNAMFAETYRTHPYRYPILGTRESVAAFDRPRVRGFYERWYCPSNLVVVAAGDVDRAHLLARVGEAFGDLPRGDVQHRRAAEPEQKGLRTTLLARPFERASVELAWPTVGLAHPDAAYLDLLAYLLGTGDSSRLVRRVKEWAGLVDRIDAYSYTPLDPGVSSIDFETATDRVEDAIAACVREVERLRSTPVSEEEIEKARINFVANEHFERESVSGLAAKLGGFQVTGGGWQAERAYLERVKAATPADLQRVAETYLRPERLTVGAVLPEAEASQLDRAAVERAVERAVGDADRRLGAPRPAETSGSDLVTYTLDGGATLHVLPRRSLPIVAARAALLGGLLAETEATSGLSAFTSAMWLRGTESRSAADFARAVETRAAEIDQFAGRSSFGLTLETPVSTLEPALDLFAEVLCEPAFDATEIERERRDTLAAIERREDRLAQRAFLLFTQEHFRHHPYRMPTLGSKEAVGAFDREALLAHQRRLVNQQNLVLAFAGDVDPDAIAGAVSQRLADLPSGAFEPPSPAAEDAPGEIRRACLRKDRAQAHLVVGFRGVAVDDDDRFALEVISQLLAGQGGRLFLELRDKQGLAYAVSASSVEGLMPGYFVTYIATAPERLDEAREGLLRELARLLDAPPEAGELERARRYLTGNFAIDQQRNAVHAAQIALNDRYGLGPESHLAYPERVAAVGEKDVLRVARRILRLDAYTEAVVRP
ncbi:MAG: M16 family metallopeptidase [Myxococcota bacterium]